VRWLRAYGAYMGESVPQVVQRIISGFRDRVDRGRRGRKQTPLLAPDWKQRAPQADPQGGEEQA
jgi:hypothetical protein